MAVAVVGAVFLMLYFRAYVTPAVARAENAPCSTLPSLLNQYGGQSCYGKQYRSHIARCAHRLARTADLDLLGGKRKRKEKQDV